MARVDKKKQLRSSILDRLIDDEPHLQIESEKNKHQQIKEMRQSVRRDLENLLNARYRIVAPPGHLTQLENSLLNYGLPDLATVNTNNIGMRKAFVRDLERILRKFEPRFKSVKVIMQDNSDEVDRTFRFRVHATLYADPAPETVIFDSVLEPVSRSVNVEETHG